MIILIVILAAVLLIWKPFFREEIIPEEKIGIAVVYFENRTGDKTILIIRHEHGKRHFMQIHSTK